MGQGKVKANLHIGQFYTGIENGLRAKFIARPLLTSVMEYSTKEAVKLMLDNGANLTEFYSELEPFGPVAFWAFRNCVNLQTTLEICQVIPIHLRDSKGSSLLHYTCALSHSIQPNDKYGWQWFTLILAVLLKRGVRLEWRDEWGRIAYDLLVPNNLELTSGSDKLTNRLDGERRLRAVEEEGPNLFDLQELIDSKTGALLKPEQLINKRVIDLVGSDKLDLVEDLILYGYDRLESATSGPPRFKTAKYISQQKGFTEMFNLLDKASAYRMEMGAIHKTVMHGELNHFVQMTSEKQLIMCRDWRSRTILHIAVLCRRTNFVLLLVELLPELVLSQDCLGRTPLHYAICLPDNRRLFLKIISKYGNVDKQIKDFNNVSIGQYGTYYDKGVPGYKTLIYDEKSKLIREPNWPNKYQTRTNGLETKLSSLPCIVEEKKLIQSMTKPKLAINDISINYPLAYPNPGAFNATKHK